MGDDWGLDFKDIFNQDSDFRGETEMVRIRFLQKRAIILDGKSKTGNLTSLRHLFRSTAANLNVFLKKTCFP